MARKDILLRAKEQLVAEQEAEINLQLQELQKNCITPEFKMYDDALSKATSDIIKDRDEELESIKQKYNQQLQDWKIKVQEKKQAFAEKHKKELRDKITLQYKSDIDLIDKRLKDLE